MNSLKILSIICSLYILFFLKLLYSYIFLINEKHEKLIFVNNFILLLKITLCWIFHFNFIKVIFNNNFYFL